MSLEGFELADLERVEALVTGILVDDAEAQTAACDGLSEEAETLARAGASIVVGMVCGYAVNAGMAPSRVWRLQMQRVIAARAQRSAGEAGTPPA